MLIRMPQHTLCASDRATRAAVAAARWALGDGKLPTQACTKLCTWGAMACGGCDTGFEMACATGEPSVVEPDMADAFTAVACTRLGDSASMQQSQTVLSIATSTHGGMTYNFCALPPSVHAGVAGRSAPMPEELEIEKSQQASAVHLFNRSNRHRCLPMHC